MSAVVALRSSLISHRGRSYRAVEGPGSAFTLRVVEPPAAAGAHTVALLHGMEEGWDVWDGFADGLAAQARVSLLDLPWNGARGHRWTDEAGAGAWIDRALALLPEPASAVIAHSFGANALLEHLDARGPGALRAVVLISPFYAGARGLDWPMLVRYVERFEPFLRAAVRARQAPGRSCHDVTEAAALRIRDRMGALGCLQFLNVVARTPFLRLQDVRIPVLIVGGEDDFYSLPGDCHRLAAALPRAEVRLLAGGGHFPMIEDRPRLLDLVQDFLSRSLEGTADHTVEDQ